MLRARQSSGREASQTHRVETWSLSRLQSHPALQREGWERTHGGLWVSEHDLIPQTRRAAPGLDRGTAAAGAPGQEGRETPPEHLPLPLHNSPWPKTIPFPGFQLFLGGIFRSPAGRPRRRVTKMLCSSRRGAEARARLWEAAS